MSNAVRKARKRRNEPIVRAAKVPTVEYKTRSQLQVRRRADREGSAIVDGLVTAALENRADLWRSVSGS